jgi:hypothetical protein
MHAKAQLGILTPTEANREVSPWTMSRRRSTNDERPCVYCTVCVGSVLQPCQLVKERSELCTEFVARSVHASRRQPAMTYSLRLDLRHGGAQMCTLERYATNDHLLLSSGSCFTSIQIDLHIGCYSRYID